MTYITPESMRLRASSSFPIRQFLILRTARSPPFAGMDPPKPRKPASTAPPSPSPAAPSPPAQAAPVPRVSLPSSWFLDPFWAKIRKMVRPSTCLTRRKELMVEMSMPREPFEEIMAPVKEATHASPSAP